jgi:hypothetical protein
MFARHTRSLVEVLPHVVRPVGREEHTLLTSILTARVRTQGAVCKHVKISLQYRPNLWIATVKQTYVRIPTDRHLKSLPLSRYLCQWGT